MQKAADMILSTTHQIEGSSILEYLGIVSSEIIVGAHVFKDMFASFRDIVGGRARSYERELQSARESAVVEVRRQAHSLGANAIVGMQFEVEVLGRNGSMLMVCVHGTAVRTEKHPSST